MIEQPTHPLELAFAALPTAATPDERLELIWQWYESSAGRTIARPPSEADRQLIAQEMTSQDLFSIILKPRSLRLKASSTLVTKASAIRQLACPACELMENVDGSGGLVLTAAIDVEPWSRQAERPVRLANAIRTQLASEGRFTPWDSSPLCLTIVSFVPRSRRGIKDSDNLVKGLLDGLTGVLYDDDRRVQCLTSRRVEYAGSQGYYLIHARAVHPWGADVVYNDPIPAKRLSGTRIV